MWRSQTTDILPGLEEEGLRQLYPTGSDVGKLFSVLRNLISIASVGSVSMVLKVSYSDLELEQITRRSCGR